MNTTVKRWSQQLEARIVDRQDSTSSLLLVQVTLPILLLLFALQWGGIHDDGVRALYDPVWLLPSLWFQGVLIVWLMGMGVLAWQRRHVSDRMPWLVQMSAVPAVLGVVVLALAHGIKDSPMTMVMLEQLVFARALFSLQQLRWAFLLSLMAVVLAEVGTAQHWAAYAPLLAAPIYPGGALLPWWAWWVRVVFSAAALPLSGVMFFLAATLHRHRHELETLVRTDMLTGLANRREFMTRLEREAHRQARSGRPLSVVLFDVDHFKRVNDTWGHPVGDEVLAKVGEILRFHTREQVDTAARYGGEEFVLLLPETDLTGAQHVAEKISARLREHAFTVDGQTFTVTQSVGIAQVVEGDTGWALKVADRNLYQAKRAGRDRIVASMAFAEELGHA
ncbi:GGDEF domain-containing protein [Aquabacterium sp. NJ1]|uniref:GGDEF domain-containing protein n=1 Tax=Aquabacterium sp. NJ1 TaxID=1538295 RepID=UPI00126A01BA|nr:GGDEF domain-containing protein [Aquabacterium sp. NJ1]